MLKIVHLSPLNAEYWYVSYYNVPLRIFILKRLLDYYDKCLPLFDTMFLFIYMYMFNKNCSFIAENENFSVVEYHALQKELDERNTQRDELLFKIKVTHIAFIDHELHG